MANMPKPVNEMLMGKYKGKTFEEIVELDESYLRWYRDTTDPADVKNQGKYAKQNQARIAYIDKLLSGKPVPEKKAVKSLSPETINIKTTTFENISKCLISIEEKIDVLLNRSKVEDIEIPVDGPDEGDGEMV